MLNKRKIFCLMSSVFIYAITGLSTQVFAVSINEVMQEGESRADAGARDQSKVDSVADQTEKILRAVGARLRPGGTLLLSQVEPDWCRQQDQGWMLRAADGQLLHRRIRFDEPTQTLIDEVSIADHAGQPPEPIPAQRLRLYKHDDLRALLTRAGFSDVVIQVGVPDARQRLLATSETYAAGTWA